MKKVSISTRHRKDGNYEARIVINGKRYSRYGKSINEVKKKARALQEESEKGHVIAKHIRLNIALERYLVDMKRPKVKSTTYDRAESTFKHHIKDETLGRMQIGAITPQDIQALLSSQCDTGLSQSSIKKIYNLLGEFFRYATATKIIGCNPMELVEMPHISNIQYKQKEMEVLTVEEMKRVISVAEQIDKKGKPVFRYGEAIILLLLTGLRSGELRALNIKDVDFNRKLLYVRQNIVYSKDRENGGIRYSISEVKTQKSNRVIPLNDRAVLALKKMLETTCNYETGYFVCTRTGKILTHSNLQKCYSKILEKANVKHMGMHSTRHTFATVVLKNAEDKGQIKEVSELLGHSQVSTTYTYYIKTAEDDKRNLLNQLDVLVS